MNDPIRNFAFKDKLVRKVDVDGQPWFVANDVCACLALTNPRKAVADLDEDEKGVTTSDTLGGRQELNIVSLPGVFRLIFRSRKEEAEEFKRWLAHEVLPEIMATGGYNAQLAAPPTVDMDIESLAIWRMKLDMQKEARLLFGPNRARTLWRMLGFPELEPPLIATALSGDGLDCLAHLLDFPLDDGATVLMHIQMAAATGDVLYRPLAAIGIRIADEPETGVLVATAAPPMRPVFRGTKWADGRHVAALRTLSGVVTGKSMRFARMMSHSVFVPERLLRAK